MWIKKSPRELSEESRARRLCFGLGAMCVVFFLYAAVAPRGRFHLPIGARVAAWVMVVVMLLAWQRRARWHRAHSSVWVCEQCNAVRDRKDQPFCGCGGTLTRLSELNWVEISPFQESTGLPPNKENALHSAHAV